MEEEQDKIPGVTKVGVSKHPWTARVEQSYCYGQVNHTGTHVYGTSCDVQFVGEGALFGVPEVFQRYQVPRETYEKTQR